ncbi:hypothetical protein ABW21_db0209080 [Orbilia brochopaga]|nr:hypothetical protein ABW21_db0209080 [Drechslerella brochopaga]
MSDSKSKLSPTAASFEIGPASRSNDHQFHPRTNDELTPLVEAHVESILSSADEDTTDFAPSFDLTKPSPELAACIDHTLLKQDATPDQILNIVREATKYGFKSCCVNGTHISFVTSNLAALVDQSSATKAPIPCAVVGFPLGASATAVKIYETTLAILDGAREIDMVISVGHLKARDYASVYTDIARVVHAASSGPNSRPLTPTAASATPSLQDPTKTPPSTNGVPVKVIIEASLLTDEEKVAACYLASIAGATFVKTSTGFASGGAAVQDVRLMRRAVAHVPMMQVKASGGIRTFEQCVAMIKAGAHRIGASSGVTIMKSQEGSSTSAGDGY